MSSGTPVPLRPLIGNWWNPWYAPSADGTGTPIADATLPSGGAQYPERSLPPTVMPVPANTSTPGPRHLAGINSPSGFPSAYASDIGVSLASIHMGAAPDYPGGSTDSNFQLRQFQATYGWFTDLDAANYSITTIALQSPEQCLPNGQYCFAARSRLISPPGSALTGPRYVDFHSGGVNNQPYIAAFYNLNQATVTLKYGGVLNPQRFIVYEAHGGQIFTAYDGTASQITVNLLVGAPNAYTVFADLGQSNWIQSAWLYLHDELVFPNRDYVPLVLKPPPTPTPTPCPYPPGDPHCTG